MMAAAQDVTLFLAGDVMTGRGIDQILAHPGDPWLQEGYVRSALGYVELAEAANGPIPRRVPPGYVWGDLLPELDRRQPDLRLANLETAVTVSDNAAPKGINYRMNPANTDVLTAAGLDAVGLANNHVMDWTRGGLLETLASLDAAGLPHAGAGEDAAAATRPVTLGTAAGPVTFLAFGMESSGIPSGWAAGEREPGVALLSSGTEAAVESVAQAVAAQAGPVVLSIHWGPNWGYSVPARHRSLAHALIDRGLADIVFGHSSHHPMAAEVYGGRLILYGCGDLINDYEGIGGEETYRPDLVLGWLARIGADGSFRALDMLPFRLCRFRLQSATADEADWLRGTMARECGRFGADVDLTGEGTLRLRS